MHCTNSGIYYVFAQPHLVSCRRKFDYHDWLHKPQTRPENIISQSQLYRNIKQGYILHCLRPSRSELISNCKMAFGWTKLFWMVAGQKSTTYAIRHVTNMFKKHYKLAIMFNTSDLGDSDLVALSVQYHHHHMINRIEDSCQTFSETQGHQWYMIQ